MAEFKIDGHEYRSGKMPARTQFHVMRRMAPMLKPFFGLMESGAGNSAAVIAFIEAIGSLGDTDSDYILDRCLTVVQRKQGEALWSNVTTPDGNHLMFEDMSLVVQLEAVARVIKDNFEEVFQKGLAAWSGEASP